jgi:hypothetical protein
MIPTTSHGVLKNTSQYRNPESVTLNHKNMIHYRVLVILY